MTSGKAWRSLAEQDAVFTDEVGYQLMTEISKTSNAERVFEAGADASPTSKLMLIDDWCVLLV